MIYVYRFTYNKTSTLVDSMIFNYIPVSLSFQRSDVKQLQEKFNTIYGWKYFY